jgi:hypothetical protein
MHQGLAAQPQHRGVELGEAVDAETQLFQPRVPEETLVHVGVGEKITSQPPF